MIPLVIKLKIPREKKRPVNLYLPVFIVWLLIFCLLLVALPFVLLAALFSWRAGYGLKLLLIYPLIFSMLWHMQGLVIDVQSDDTFISFSFI